MLCVPCLLGAWGCSRHAKPSKRLLQIFLALSRNQAETICGVLHILQTQLEHKTSFRMSDSVSKAAEQMVLPKFWRTVTRSINSSLWARLSSENLVSLLSCEWLGLPSTWSDIDNPQYTYWWSMVENLWDQTPKICEEKSYIQQNWGAERCR